MRVILAAALGVSMAEAAMAQQAAAPDAGPPDVVVVTGVGPARTTEELIAHTTTLDETDIVQRLDGGLGDTLAGLPGVSSTAFGPGASRPIIRGLGAERVQVLTNGIGVIDASSASPDHAVTADPLGAERIEILRGPAGLAYGGGATGGVVNVIDGLIAERLPTEPVSASGYAGYTSVDEGTMLAGRVEGAAGNVVGVLSLSSRETGDIEIPGMAESARFHAAEEADEAEGGEEHDEHAEASGVLENSWTEADNISGGLSFVGDRGFVGVAVRRQESKYGIVGGHEHEHEEGEEEHAEESPFIVLEQTRMDLRAGYRPDGGLIARFTGALSVVDYTHTEFEAPGVAGTIFDNSGYEGRAEAEHREFAGFKGSLGLQASRRSFEAIGDEAFVTPTETRQAGVFLFETYERGDWGLEGGLRADRVELDNEVQGERSFDIFNASFGVHGHVTDNLFLGATASRTERAPTDVELFADGAHIATRQYEVGDAALDKETGVNLELSARWEAGPLELGASVYRFAFDNFIYLEPTGEEIDETPVFQAVEREATFTGGELTAALNLGQGMGAAWRIDGSADIVRAELDAVAAGSSDLPRIPPASAMLGVEAQFGRLNARLEGKWAAEQDRVATFELPTDSYTTLDARATFTVAKGLDLIVEGTNLTDEEVRLHASPLKDLAPMAGRGLRVGLLAKY